MTGERDGNEGERAAPLGVTRRRLLYGLTATSVAGSAGVGAGAAGMFNDSETLTATTGSGVIDLETAWEPSGTTVTGGGDSGAEVARFWLPHRGGDNNPAYVWVRTRCPGGNHEEHLSVRVVLETPGGAYELATGSLGQVRAQLGEGVFLHALDGDAPGPLEPRASDATDEEGTWALRLEWTADDDVQGEGSVEFELTFHAVQARNLSVAEAEGTYDPGWEACDGFSPATSGADGFSYAAFGADGDLAADDFSTMEPDGFSLEYELADSAPDVEEIAIKEGTELFVLTDPDPRADTVAMSDADETYEQSGNSFGGDPERTSSNPIPDYCGVLKYETDGGDYVTVSECDGT